MGLSSMEDLFTDIPRDIRCEGIALPPGKSEMEVERALARILQENRDRGNVNSFVGAGIYDHFIPAVVDYLSGRSELLTSYTPYQGEISQGMLQSLFEYQSYVTELTGMDMSNSSLYDAATAVGEAAIMCRNVTRKKEFLVASPMTRRKRSVLDNYTKHQGIRIKDVPYDHGSGKCDPEAIRQAIDRDTCGIYVETPNFFGIFEEEVEAVSEALGTGRKRPPLVVGYDLLASPLVKNPGEMGADIAIGEVQFGIPPSYGGPTAGYMACNREYVRKMPGRLIGYTRDREGRDSFVMTLQTREQHIRRQRATSNICSNEALCAVRAAMTLACLGPGGLREMSVANLENAHALAEALSDFDMIRSPRFPGSYFNEFVVSIDAHGTDPKDIHRALLDRGTVFGYPLAGDFPELADSFLLCATETNTRDEMEKLLSDLRAVGVI